MIINPQISLQRLVLSLSEALDGVHPGIVDHQQRTAYVAISTARRMGFTKDELVNTFYAAALHDIGLIGVETRHKVIHLDQLDAAPWHGEIGYSLLKPDPIFAACAEMVRHHHIRWEDGRGAERGGEPVAMATHVLSLADEVERMIDRKANVLDQVPAILTNVVSRSGKDFHPACVDAFCAVGQAEAFWLDAVSPRIYSVLLRQIDWPMLVLDDQSIGPLAEIFGRIVDFASEWTMLHTAGVAASAVALAEKMEFSPRELALMHAAGSLHDLGKLTVPAQILNKPAKLTPEEMAIMRGHTYHTFRILDTIGGMPQVSEWAAFHHERLDGKGYPFHHVEHDLTLGSRIMAVADVFTAVAEDRPYRKGMTRNEALAVLEKLAADHALDGDVTAVVRREYDAIDAARRQKQAAYGREQASMMRAVKAQPTA